ncbi:MAG TPA: response regulator [Pseudolabrys sp.]|jgi:DNA-binding NtrC family response regulator
MQNTSKQDVAKPTALVVEDDQDQRELVSFLLEECDMAVIQCESAESAEAVLERVGESLSMIFTDVRLAGPMSGAELAEVAKRRFPDLTVIVTSGSEAPALPAGAMFMQKPWRALDILREAERASH